MARKKIGENVEFFDLKLIHTHVLDTCTAAAWCCGLTQHDICQLLRELTLHHLLNNSDILTRNETTGKSVTWQEIS